MANKALLAGLVIGVVACLDAPTIPLQDQGRVDLHNAGGDAYIMPDSGTDVTQDSLLDVLRDRDVPTRYDQTTEDARFDETLDYSHNNFELADLPLMDFSRDTESDILPDVVVDFDITRDYAADHTQDQDLFDINFEVRDVAYDSSKPDSLEFDIVRDFSDITRQDSDMRVSDYDTGDGDTGDFGSTDFSVDSIVSDIGDVLFRDVDLDQSEISDSITEPRYNVDRGAPDADAGESDVVVPPVCERTSEILFQPYETFAIGSEPTSVAIGDLNNDGNNDVVVHTERYFDPEADYQIHVFFQNESGELLPPTSFPAGNGSSIAVADVTGDRLVDIVVSGKSEIGVFAQADEGFLLGMSTYASGHTSHSNVHRVAVGNLNDDDLTDIVTIDWGTQSQDVDVFLQEVIGFSAPFIYSAPHGGYDDLAVGDVSGDARDDIIVMSGQYWDVPNFSVLTQEEDGFSAAASYWLSTESESTRGMAVADVTADGLNDIVVSYGGNRPRSHIAVFEQAEGELVESAVYTSHDRPGSVVIGDIDHDGKNDVVVAHSGFRRVGVYLQNDERTLDDEELFTITGSNYDPGSLAIGDINGDGCNDVAVASSLGDLVVLYSNE
jgi:hypothetical protein